MLAVDGLHWYTDTEARDMCIPVIEAKRQVVVSNPHSQQRTRRGFRGFAEGHFEAQPQAGIEQATLQLVNNLRCLQSQHHLF